jgi:hypothetical protein
MLVGDAKKVANEIFGAMRGESEHSPPYQGGVAAALGGRGGFYFLDHEVISERRRRQPPLRRNGLRPKIRMQIRPHQEKENALIFAIYRRL